MIKIYRVKPSIEKTVIGSSYPQIQKLPYNYDLTASDSVYELDMSDMPDKDPNLNNLPLEQGALTTDILSCSYLSGGLLISEQVKQILEGHNLPKSKFYKASVKSKKGEIFNYYYFYFKTNLIDLIDLHESTFYIGRTPKLIRQTYRFKDIKEYENHFKVLKSRREILKPLTIKFKRLPEVDIFSVLPQDINKIYITDNLAQAFITNNITGLEVDITDSLKID